MPHFRIGGANAVAVQSIATNLLLPPLLLVLVMLAAVLGLRRRAAGWVVGVSAVALLLLATPFVAGHLRAGLESGFPESPTLPAGTRPGAIIVLSAEGVRTQDGYQPGPLTLERMRAGVALARRTGLPMLVTGGPLAPEAPPIAQVMADSLAADFALPARWIEPRARDTRENAERSVALLRAEGIVAGFVVTHAWHMPRSLEAFDRTGFVALAAPVRIHPSPDGRASDWIPRPDHLGQSWFMLREWAGRIVYRLRDGPAPAGQGGPGGRQ